MSWPGLPDHLGGFVPAGDPATWFPDLWKWMVEEHGVQSVIDVGCGAGHSVQFFKDLGCRVIGIDGVAQEDPDIIEWDFMKGPLMTNDEFDLAWSCEFVEHVPEQHVGNFMETFKAAKIVLLTHSEPGQPGHHHVNSQASGFWLEQFDAAGFEFDPGLTIEARRLAFQNDFYWSDDWYSENWWGFHVNHFVRSGLAFRRL